MKRSAYKAFARRQPALARRLHEVMAGMPPPHEAGILVTKAIPGAEYNKKDMTIDLPDGRKVMFALIGREGKGRSFMTVYENASSKAGKDITITSVKDALKKLGF